MEATTTLEQSPTTQPAAVSTNTLPSEPCFDVIVAGGGIAGILTAARLVATRPGIKIALLERELDLGGRLRLGSSEHGRRGYGLAAVSDALYGLCQQSLRAFDVDLAEAGEPRQSIVAVLAGNRLAQQSIDQWFTAKGARMLGGMAASKHWPEVEELMRQGAVAAPHASADDDEDSEADADKAKTSEAKGARSHALSHYWKQTRKAPASIVLEHFAGAFGIPDVWDADIAALAQRAAFHSSRLHMGEWQQSVQALVREERFAQAVTVMTGNRIVDADYKEGSWVLTCEKGRYRAPSLVVAQPPWQATAWLKRALWPAPLLQLASKTKPVSIVVLTEKVTSPEAAKLLPDVTLVPAEKVQIVREGSHEVCFQATIDFELSLQAPAVVKAVKALKRARKKLLQLYPDAVTEQNFIALLPVAWAQSPQHSDRRWLERLERKPFNSPVLAFCGDAYGASYDGDANILKSVGSACAAILTLPAVEGA